MKRIKLSNSTTLSTEALAALFEREVHGWAVGLVDVRVRYSRGADYSGSCYYGDRRIYINIGKHLRYPYRLATHVAKAVTIGRRWFKSAYCLNLRDGHDLALFIFMHELYHLLVKTARRNTRQKESMCDRFATRCLVARCGLTVRTSKHEPVPRNIWDFQDLEGFVAAARDRRVKRPLSERPAPRAAARRPRPSGLSPQDGPMNVVGEQLSLFLL